jgi:broad specificity phosphatase PhoE
MSRVHSPPNLNISRVVTHLYFLFQRILTYKFTTEGLLSSQIRAARTERGLDVQRPWNIWVDGCEEGESATEVSSRLDRVIANIKEIQGPYMHGEKGVDVVLIAHGHILRAFAKRWIGFELGMRLPLMLEPGAVGVLSYEHHRVDEPAILLGVNMGVEK